MKSLVKVGAKRNALPNLCSSMLSTRKPGLMLPCKDIARAAGQSLASLRPKINADLRERISEGDAHVIPVWGRTRTGAVRLDGIMLSTSKLALPTLAANCDREFRLADNHQTRGINYAETYEITKG